MVLSKESQQPLGIPSVPTTQPPATESQHRSNPTILRSNFKTASNSTGSHPPRVCMLPMHIGGFKDITGHYTHTHTHTLLHASSSVLDCVRLRLIACT